MTVLDPECRPWRDEPSSPGLPRPYSVPAWAGIGAVLLMIATAAVLVVRVGLGSPGPNSVDGHFLGSVHRHTQLAGLGTTDHELVRTGLAVCGTLDRAPSTFTVLASMYQLTMTNRWNNGDAAAVVGSAIGAYCPQHIALVAG